MSHYNPIIPVHSVSTLTLSISAAVFPKQNNYTATFCMSKFSFSPFSRDETVAAQRQHHHLREHLFPLSYSGKVWKSCWIIWTASNATDILALQINTDLLRCSGPCPVMFWVSPRMEIPQHSLFLYFTILKGKKKEKNHQKFPCSSLPLLPSCDCPSLRRVWTCWLHPCYQGPGYSWPFFSLLIPPARTHCQLIFKLLLTKTFILSYHFPESCFLASWPQPALLHGIMLPNLMLFWVTFHSHRLCQ